MSLVLKRGDNESKERSWGGLTAKGYIATDGLDNSLLFYFPVEIEVISTFKLVLSTSWLITTICCGGKINPFLNIIYPIGLF